MSLILDALTRAETEKRNARTEGVDILTPEVGSSAENRRFSPWLLAGLALLAGALLTTLVYRTVRSAGPEQGVGQSLAAGRERAADARSPSQSVAREPAVAVSSPPEPVAKKPNTMTAEPRVVARPAVQVSSEASRDPTESKAQPRPGDRRVDALYAERGEATSPSPARAEPEPDLTRAPVATPEPGVTETPVDLDAVLRDVREEARSDGLEPHPAPLLADLSQQFRNRVPTLMYLRHDFNSQGRSTVLINGQTLAVGQRTRGVQVREVLGDSVILSFDGTDFRLRALNSWVNL